MRKIYLTSFIVLLCFFVKAQEKTVSGKVISVEDGGPLPGVNVVLKGTAIRTTIDWDGTYKINIPSAGGVLVFSFIGRKTVEVTIGERTIVDVSMEEDWCKLTEVVCACSNPQPIRRKIELTEVFFDLGKYDLNEKSLAELDEVVRRERCLLRNPQIMVEVQAHWLSRKRTEAVVSYLVKKGIASSRLKQGFWLDTSYENSQKNRTVTIILAR